MRFVNLGYGGFLLDTPLADSKMMLNLKGFKVTRK